MPLAQQVARVIGSGMPRAQRAIDQSAMLLKALVPGEVDPQPSSVSMVSGSPENSRPRLACGSSFSWPPVAARRRDPMVN